jgi:dinuclear metal center YbgI/SA1388 family protein
MPVVLSRLLTVLEGIAPLAYAEDWDNVGLLIDPAGTAAISVSRLLLTIDLTPTVMNEAAERRADMIVAYHPPIFKGVRRLRQSTPSERVIMQAVRSGLPVYSPHTAVDAAPGGVNDWLAQGLGPSLSEPLVQATHRASADECRVGIVINPDEIHELQRSLVEELGVARIAHTGMRWVDVSGHEHEDRRLEFVVKKSALTRVATVMSHIRPAPDWVWDVLPLVDKPHLGAGMGRSVRLQDALKLDEIVAALKKHLRLEKLWVATSERHERGDHQIERVAVCAGAGGSLFENSTGYDLYVTGEMRHHQVREKVAAGSSVIVCGHTNTERGYLPHLAQRIDRDCHGEIKVMVSKRDRDPLVVV